MGALGGVDGGDEWVYWWVGLGGISGWQVF